MTQLMVVWMFAASPTPQEARAFIEKVNAELKVREFRLATAEWVGETYITDDTEQLVSWARQDQMAFLGQANKDALRFRSLKGLDTDTARALQLLRRETSMPAPIDAARREQLAGAMSKLEGHYGKAKWCGKDGKGPCRDLEELEEVMRTETTWEPLLAAWAGWHSTSVETKPTYVQAVRLANEGAQEIGFKDLGDLWRSGYDMSSEDFEKESARLWTQVKPLYDDLHCYVRSKLQARYGKDKVPDGRPIPAHLLGNMWAQEWGNIYPLVEPYRGTTSLDITKALHEHGYNAVKLMKLGESFFTSLGFDPLPETFWARSMLTRPRDREVVCHASAWDVTYNNDLRIKMCIEGNQEDLITVHHELGHNYYDHAYYQRPMLFQTGAHDGFHEAIGDSITLSITPAYLKRLGLVEDVPRDPHELIDVMLRDALDKIAFLPFSKLVDEWRWDVFSGKTPPAQYNQAWWALRRKYQGVEAPVGRTEADFDPGAKYHVPAFVPYTRYFLARILQFQFHRALCQAAGFKGPLHECSIYGNKAAGQKLWAMLQLGASKPWPDALEVLTGQRQMDASALVDYYAPLQTWLKEQNQGKVCGW